MQRLNRDFNAGEYFLIPFAHKGDKTEVLQHGVNGVRGAQLLGNHVLVGSLHQRALRDGIDGVAPLTSDQVA